MTTREDITGRDGVIIAHALATAIAVQDALAKHYQANPEDMKTLLDCYGESIRAIIAHALATAIAAQDALPEHHQQRSNLEDGKTLLDCYGEGIRAHFLALAHGYVDLLRGVPEQEVLARVMREMAWTRTSSEDGRAGHSKPSRDCALGVSPSDH